MKMPPAIAAKVARLAAAADFAPRVLDLFAGCGGLSLGFHAAGFRIAAAMEIDELAARSHASNLFKGHPESVIRHHSRPRDVTRVEPEEVTRDFRLGAASRAIDVIVGGPPCQAYARVGRAKLREVAEHPEAFKIDPRANLYLRYLHYIERLMPLAVLMENVPDILNHGGHNVVQEIVEALDAMGYEARYSLLNTAHYGVPQMRDRVFLIAFHRSLRVQIRFPAATRRCDLPAGYAGTRSVALKLVDLFGGGAYAPPEIGQAPPKPAITAFEAIGDLPAITLHREVRLRRGPRRFDTFVAYPADGNPSDYAREMRSWPGFESAGGIKDHVLRCLPRDTPIFEAMDEGDEYPAAHRTAMRLFEEEARRRRVAADSAEWSALRRAMVPPYDPSKFSNRWWKLRRHAPVRTLTAHIGKDTYSHIHYDSAQARVITVREAARLQSFPDGFVFVGTMNPAFRQIGNAVPPVMARELARSILGCLRRAAATGSASCAA